MRELLRLQRNKWLAPLLWTRIEDTIKPGAEVNRLRVVAKGREVTLFVNDREVRKIKGQPPQGGGRLGPYSELTNKMEGEFVYDNFVVTNAPLTRAAGFHRPTLPIAVRSVGRRLFGNRR